MKNPELLKPGGQEQPVSILFSDIADFSRLSQELDPEDLFNFLNEYYDAALQGIHRQEGTVVQIIGDAIYAVWNAPVPQPDHAARACRAAMDLHVHLIRFDAAQRSLPARTRVGIHTGMAVVGNLGSKTQFNFATIGKNVNLASRLEGLNKHLKTDLLATRAIQKFVENEVVSRRIGYFQMKGFGEAIEVHELLGQLDARLAESTKPWRDAFAEGLKHFQRKQFALAEQRFRETIELRQAVDQSAIPRGEVLEKDGPSTFYLERIAEFKQTPPPEHWHGEIEMRDKRTR